MREIARYRGKKKKKKKEKKEERKEKGEERRKDRARGNYRKRGTRLTLPVLLETQKGPRRGDAVVPLFLPTCRFAWWRRVPAGAFDFSRAVDRVRVRSWRGQKEEEREGGREGEEETIERELESGVYREAPGGPRAGPARNAHLKRGRNGRGAPGVFLTRIPNVRTCQPPSHPSASCRPPAPLVLFPLSFGLSILSCLGLFFSCHHPPRAYLARSCLREIRIFDGQFSFLEDAGRIVAGI